jgi:hypothetical protein
MASLSGVAGQPALQHRAGQVAVARQDLDRSPRKTGSEHCFSGSEDLRIWPKIGSQILRSSLAWTLESPLKIYTHISKKNNIK